MNARKLFLRVLILLSPVSSTIVVWFRVSGVRYQRRPWTLTPEPGILRLLHQFNFTRQPLTLVPCLSWAVETQEAEPALAGNGLEPVRLLAFGCLSL